MQKNIFILFILFQTAVFSVESIQTPLDCKIHLSLTQATPSQIKITISHDANCSVVIEDLNRTITIATIKESNQTIEQEQNKTIIPKMITLAKSKIGTPYKRAGVGDGGFDCSGFVYYLFKENNITIPRTSKNQSKLGVKLSREEIEVGDILSFDTTNAGHINHSGVYLGDGEFIHASSGKAYGVTTSKLDKGFYKDKFRWGVRVEE